MKALKRLALGSLALITSGSTDALAASGVQVGKAAPDFTLMTDAGESFSLASRKGQWTILFFYPKADTPGCTKQACAYRDTLPEIRKTGAEVYGISADDVKALQAFRKKYSLSFPLLADPEMKAITAYGVKMPLLKMSKRWTFIIGPELTIRHIEEGADPVLDSKKMIEKITELKKQTKE